MNTDKAIHEAQRWLGYLDAQKAKAKKMVELARLAKTDHAEALRQKRQMDASPTVYDGGNLEPAVRFLIAEIERLKALLVEARDDIREGVENEYPPAMRHYPAEMRRYQAGMDIVHRIDAALAEVKDA